MKRAFLLLISALLLVACSSREKAEKRPAPVEIAGDGKDSLSTNMRQGADSVVDQTRDGFREAALSPLEDLNLRRDKIPPPLAMIENPYDLPVDLTCKDVENLLKELNGLLGADWDAMTPDERLRTEKLADSAATAALDAIASEASGMIPFRDVVRKATGADSHEKRLSLAFKIGAQRRAYLKGYGLALGCDGKARPDFTKMPPRTVQWRGDRPDGKPVKTLRPIWSRAMPWQGDDAEKKTAPQK